MLAGTPGREEEGRGGPCEQTHPAPIHTLSSAELQEWAEGLSIHDPTIPASFSSTHFQRASSKQVSNAQEGNDRPQSPRRVLFFSFFLSKTLGDLWRTPVDKVQKQFCAHHWPAWWQKQPRRALGLWLRPSIRGAAAPSSGHEEHCT